MEYLAHKSLGGKTQTIKEHSENTAALCKEYAIEPLKRICCLTGLLHDVGKYQKSFQEKIRTGANISIEHSIAGAQFLKNEKTIYSRLMQFCIAGHHTGIPDYGEAGDIPEQPTLVGRLKRETEDYSGCEELAPQMPDEREIISFNSFLMEKLRNDTRENTIRDLVEKYAFTVRYCYSCLVDADSLDASEASGNGQLPSLTADFDICSERIDQRMTSFINITHLQQARSEIQKQAYENITKDADIYLMNMPTGSGKTLCSMKCALTLAKKFGLKKIIYVIPYNSIIDQTAEVFDNLFEDNAQILRHQSSFSYETDSDDTEDWRVYAGKVCENWDAKIIITTAVQFFETIYSSKRSKLRKLHNIADSVLIFDEAHLMPREFMQPCLNAIRFLTDSFHCKSILLTATMPDYRHLLSEYSGNTLHVEELIKDKSLFSVFQSNNYKYLGNISDTNLAKHLASSPVSLVIMNTKQGARDIFSLCTGKKYCLTTYLTGFDRSQQIEEIRNELDRLCRDYPDCTDVPENRRITVVATSLIEAGVDLDFASVFRELAGIDNILQAGGRCNRNGLRKTGNVRIFRREDNPTPINLRQSIAQRILEEYEDISAPEAVDEYYKLLFFSDHDLFEKKSIGRNCRRPEEINLRTYDENFQLISDNGTESVVACVNEESRDLREKLISNEFINPRKVQKYTCTVTKREMEILMNQGVVDDCGKGIFFLMNDDYYDRETGILLSGKDFYID